MENQVDTSRSILLVEDNPMDVDLTLRAFSAVNFANNIDVARDGEEAVARITQWDEEKPLPLLILLDLKLPKVDGLEVLHILKNHPRFKVVPVVVLTSSSDDTDIQMAYELGVNSYIVKPVDFKKFVDIAAKLEIYWLATTQLPR